MSPRLAGLLYDLTTVALRCPQDSQNCYTISPQLHYDVPKICRVVINNDTIMFADHPGNHRTTKHIDTKVNFAREAQTNGFIKLVYVPTAEQLADGMTKALPFALF